MSNSISTLMIRNLRDVFGENDPARRRAAIDELYTEDCVFYDPTKGVYRGRDEIERVAGAIKATHPDFRYQPCLLKNLGSRHVFVPPGLLVSRFFSFSRPGSCSCDLRGWLTAEESHQPFQVLRRCRQIELLAHEAHPA